MDRIWQWTWDRYGTGYAWALFTVALPVSAFMYYVFIAFPIVAFEDTGRYLEAAGVTLVAVPVLQCGLIAPSRRLLRPAEQWAAGRDVDRMTALEGTYLYARRIISHSARGTGPWAVAYALAVGAVAGATWTRLIQYAIIGGAMGAASQLVAFGSSIDAAMRPVRAALAAGTDTGDSLPRSHPTFASRAAMSMGAASFFFAVGGALLAGTVDHVGELPVTAVAIGIALTALFAAPLTVGVGFSPSLQTIRDLDAASKALRRGISRNASRSSRTTTSAPWRRRSTECRRDWPSGSAFRPRSAPTSTRPWRLGCSSRVTTSSPVNGAR